MKITIKGRPAEGKSTLLQEIQKQLKDKYEFDWSIEGEHSVEINRR